MEITIFILAVGIFFAIFRATKLEEYTVSGHDGANIVLHTLDLILRMDYVSKSGLVGMGNLVDDGMFTTISVMPKHRSISICVKAGTQWFHVESRHKGRHLAKFVRSGYDPTSDKKARLQFDDWMTRIENWR